MSVRRDGAAPGARGTRYKSYKQNDSYKILQFWGDDETSLFISTVFECILRLTKKKHLKVHSKFMLLKSVGDVVKMYLNLP